MHIGFLKNKRWKRIFVSFILLCFINQTFYLPVYALTAGPVSADYGSFEPIDTTDVVNTLAGDFVYNMPLLEIPGPEGGYPLALSYHANITPEQESGWVGLGWTLNPGAINRHVNGFPDDWFHTQSSKRDFWEGGKSTSTRVGVTVPMYGYLNVSFGLTLANDTYKGIGLGADLSVGAGYGPLRASVGFGINPYGGVYASAGIGIAYGSAPGVMAGAMLSASTDFKNGIVANISIGLSAGGSSSPTSPNKGQNIFGASLSSRGDVSFSVAGLAGSLHNSSAGAMRSRSTTFSIDLLFLSYSNAETRYWSDETSSSSIMGALHGEDTLWGFSDADVGDAYNLQEEGKNLIDHPNTSKHQGGAYPNFDKYIVAAQGIGGSFRPYKTNGNIITQNQHEFNEDRTLRFKAVQYYDDVVSSSPYFKFENEFSSYDLQLYPGLTAPDLWAYRLNEELPYSGSVDHEDGDEYLMTTAPGKHIIDHSYTEVYIDGTPRASFLYPKVNFQVNKSVPPSIRVNNGQITGYSITNTEGVTYHYNLPAYTYEEEVYQENRDHKQKLIFNRQSKTTGYAYIWHLTAITGPDYVDRGELNVLDNADYGYWVSFEYGKWNGSYTWRNPAEGVNIDDDGEFSQLSMGKKEMYYLNAIKTRSHTAVFAKSVKKDGKGASPEVFNKNYNTQLQAYTNYTNDGVFNANSALSMKLDRIYLLNRGDEDIIPIPTSPQNSSPSGRSIPCSDCEVISNVYHSNYSFLLQQQLESKAIQIIDLEYDYSLAKGTSNSFENNNTNKDGKLTLTSVSIKGRGATMLAPSNTFEYELDFADRKEAFGTLTQTAFHTSNSNLEVGDMLRVEVSYNQQPIYAGVVVSKSGSGSNYTYGLRNGTYSGSSMTATVVTTKNPPYNKNAVDMWGMYKSDYVASDNETVSRTTTALSSKSVDAWSLRKINTSSGTTMKVAYESDTYNRSVLNSARSFIIKTFTKVNDQTYYFDVDIPDGWALSHFFKAADEVDLVLAFKHAEGTSNIPKFRSSSFKPTIQSVNESLKRVYISNNSLSIRDFFNSLPGNVIYKAIMTGNIIVSDRGQLFYGGGTRVRSITTDNMDGIKATTTYGYHHINSPQTSSGITVSEPKIYPEDSMKDVLTTFGTSTSDIEAKQKVKNEYKKTLFQKLNPLVELARELPGAGVTYEYVTTTNSITHALDHVERQQPMRTEIHYQVFDPKMVERQDVDARRSQPGAGGNYVYSRNLVLKKFVAAIGQVKRMTTYNNADKKVSETINHYLHDGLEHLPHSQFFATYEQRLKQYKKQGVFKERYGEKKQVSSRGATGNTDHFYVTMSAKAEYPCVPIGNTTIDYVTQVRSSTKILEYDFYSGSVIRSVSGDPNGNFVEEEIIPAYHVFTPMRSKLWQGKNMLTQVFEKKVSLLDKDGIRKGTVSAEITMWGTQAPVKDNDGNIINQNSVWRPYAYYSWLPQDKDANGLSATVPAFDWYNLSNNSPDWKKTSEITLFNVFSKILENKDINGQYATQQYGYNTAKSVLSGSEGRYEEFTFGSAEDYVIKNGDYYYADNLKGLVRNSTVAHSGKHSVLMSPSQKGFTYEVPVSKLNPDKDYIAMVWVRSAGIGDLSGPRLYYKTDNNAQVLNTQIKVRYAAGWNLIELVIPKEALAGKQNLQVGCINTGVHQVYADDFRFSPRHAIVTTSVYDLIHGYLTYTLDNNNLYTKYTYDLEGNVTRTYRETLGREYIPLVSRNFKNIANFNHKVYRNVLMTENIIPQGCLTPVTYTVPSGKYISYFSQEDADDQAREDIQQHGQRYADDNSPCN